MLNYHHLRYFWIVAHEGNLTRAAEKIHIAQSALSMQIRKLEEDLKQPLFERQGRGLVLTEAGRIALDFADSIFATGDELLGTLGELDQPHRRVLRVGALATLSRNFQLQFLAPLLTQDEIEVVVRSGAFGELLQALEDYQIDVLLSNLSPPRDAATRWIAHAIDRQPVSLVGRPKPGRDGLSLGELIAGESLVMPTAQSSIRTGFGRVGGSIGHSSAHRGRSGRHGHATSGGAGTCGAGGGAADCGQRRT
ncbi:MAG: LysR family transcriptional regulator [Caldilineaceae bacterium]